MENLGKDLADLGKTYRKGKIVKNYGSYINIFVFFADDAVVVALLFGSNIARCSSSISAENCFLCAQFCVWAMNAENIRQFLTRSGLSAQELSELAVAVMSPRASATK